MDFISALNVSARLPPSEVDSVLSNLGMCKEQFIFLLRLGSICPKLRKFLLSRIDGRLQVLTDETTGKLFIASDFNRIGHSYRSPWSNVYTPSPAEGSELYFPPDQLRRIEMTLNELLLSYSSLYYDNAVGSAYLSESSEAGTFYGAIQIKKDIEDLGSQESHTWESYHSFSVVTSVDEDQLFVEVSMTSSALICFEFTDEVLPCTLDGSASRSGKRSFSLVKSELESFEENLVRNVGELMEDNENSLRGIMDKVAIPRCTDLGMASFGIGDASDDEVSLDSSDAMEDDYRPRISLGSMNPLHRQSARPVPAFQADLMDAISQRKLREQGAEAS